MEIQKEIIRMVNANDQFNFFSQRRTCVGVKLFFLIYVTNYLFGIFETTIKHYFIVTEGSFIDIYTEYGCNFLSFKFVLKFEVKYGFFILCFLNEFPKKLTFTIVSIKRVYF